MPEAVIDIGTNTAHLVVAEIEDHAIHSLGSGMKTVRLGEGLIQKGVIQPAAVQRALDGVKQLIYQAQQASSTSIQIVGTHVFRVAQNGSQVAKILEQGLGLPITILSETDEAKWSFQGAIWGRDTQILCSLTDVGGGSTEIITGTMKHIDHTISLPIGAVTLTEQCCIQSPLSEREIMCMEQAIKNQLQTVSFHVSDVFYAVGGTATTLAALHHKLCRYDADVVDGTELTFSKLQEIYKALLGATQREKEKILSFYPERADIIVAGTAILYVLMRHFSLGSIFVSTRGLRHGILLRNYFNKMKKESLI